MTPWVPGSLACCIFPAVIPGRCNRQGPITKSPSEGETGDENTGVGDEKDENTADKRATHASQGDYIDVQLAKQHLLTKYQFEGKRFRSLARGSSYTGQDRGQEDVSSNSNQKASWPVEIVSGSRQVSLHRPR